MDYLDPEKKKQHRLRLYIGYGLMAILIALTTVILVYLGSGYDVDRDTGDLIQNGQVLLSSDPEGASVYLDNKIQKTKTTGKLVIPSGSYNVAVKKDGYRDWNQQIALEGGKILRLDYIKLIPENLEPTITQTFASAPSQVKQSSDKRYLSLVFAEQPLSIFVYDLVRPDEPAQQLTLLPSLLGDAKTTGSLSVIDWASDNKHMLVAHSVGSVIADYLLISKDATETPVNLSTRYSLPDEAVVSLQNKIKDRYFIYTPSAKTVVTANLDNVTTALRLSAVEQFSAYDNDTILYVTSSGASTGKVAVRLTDGIEKTYLMRELAPETSYLLAVSKYGSTVVAALGATAENKVTVLRNPVGYLKADTTRTIPLATTIFLLEKPTTVSFSADASVVLARGGKKIATHYFAEDRTSRYEVPLAIESSPVTWLDGKHLSVTAGTTAYIMDFDGNNVQKLADSPGQYGVFLDNNSRSLYSFGNTTKPFQVYKSSLLIKE